MYSSDMKRLCKLRELPHHLQFNEFVLTGYRPPSHFIDCLKSTVHLHNESFNILSHSLALVYFLNQSSDYSLFWYNGDELVKLFIIIDLFVSTVPFALSVMYHTFMPHTFGVRLYTLLLKIDIFGVWFVTTFGALCSFYVTLYCLPTLHIVCLSVYVPLSLVVLYYMVVNDCKMKRVIALTIQFLFRFFILLIRLTPLITVPLIAFQYYLIMNVISSIGALINVLRIPERWFPGRCDYILNGHSLMHIAAVLSLAVGRCGTLADLTWLTSKPICVPSEI